VARRGIDIGQFLSPFRGDISGAALAAGTYNDMARGNIALRGQLSDEEQAAQRLAEQGREFDIRTGEDSRQFDDALAGTNMRQQLELDAARRKFEAEQAIKQRDLEAGIVGESVGAFSKGDINALESVRARANVAAPQLQFTMPGQALDPINPGTGLPSEAAVFGDPMKSPGLSIQRGADQLYSGDQAKVRQREQDIAGRILSPFQGGPDAQYMMPSITAGVGGAGSGMTGAEAANFALTHGDKAAMRGVMRENARMASVQKQDGAGFQQDTTLHKQIEEIAARTATKYKIPEIIKKQGDLGSMLDDIRSGVPLQQNLAKAFMMKDAIKGAASDKDASRFENAAGFWERMNNEWGKYMDGGKLSPGFAEQLGAAVEHMQLAADIKRERAAQAARDHVYNATMLPFANDEQVVRGAMQAYGAVSGEPYTEEEFAQEFARYQQVKHARSSRSLGGGGQSSSTRIQMRGDIVPGPDARPPIPGPGDNLGVAPVDGKPPRPPRASAPPLPQGGGDWDSAADALLGGQ
jgi:hypothetical protein